MAEVTIILPFHVFRIFQTKRKNVRIINKIKKLKIQNIKLLEWSEIFENIIIKSFCYNVMIEHNNRKINEQAMQAIMIVFIYNTLHIC